MSDKKLTTKQTLFISEYLKDFNATRAAIAAGYSEDTAHSMGWENLRKPDIRQAIQKYIDETLGDDRMTLKREVIDELRKIAFNTDPEVNEHNKIKALELLGKYMVMFTDNKKVEISMDDETYDKLKDLYK